MHEPEQYEPIDLLVNTCKFTGVNASTLWTFVGPNKDMAGRGNCDAFRHRACDLPWLLTMFPKWNQLQHERCKAKKAFKFKLTSS